MSALSEAQAIVLIYIPMNTPMRSLATPNKTEQGLSMIESF